MGLRPDHGHRHQRAKRAASCRRRNGRRKAYRKPEQQRWYEGETISLGIGQGYNSFTILQLAHATATLANNGIVMKPHLVKRQSRIRSRRPYVVTVVRDPSDKIAVKQSDIDIIKRAMEGVVTNGTAVEAVQRRALSGGRQDRYGPGLLAARRQLQGPRDRPSTLRDHALYHCVRACRTAQDRDCADRRKRWLGCGGGRPDRTSKCLTTTWSARTSLVLRRRLSRQRPRRRKDASAPVIVRRRNRRSMRHCQHRWWLHRLRSKSRGGLHSAGARMHRVRLRPQRRLLPASSAATASAASSADAGSAAFGCSAGRTRIAGANDVARAGHASRAASVPVAAEMPRATGKEGNGKEKAPALNRKGSPA